LLLASAGSWLGCACTDAKSMPEKFSRLQPPLAGCHNEGLNQQQQRRRSSRSFGRNRRSALFWGGSSAAPSSALPRSSLPRSRNRSASLSLRQRLFPPWNLSHQIDDKGFLKTLYRRVPGEWEPEVKLRTSHGVSARCRIRQVPGDGNCLFHSISLCLRHAVNGTHWRLDGAGSLEELYLHSHELRQKAVQCLASPTRRLFLQGRESLKATELVQAAAAQYHLTPEEYCECMSQSSVWGGGPEIVALCNLLQRPIHVYELATAVVRGAQSEPHRQQHAQHHPQSQYRDRMAEDDDELDSSPSSFVLRRMACFGSPKFDHRRPLHILSADSRFPDVPPGQQLSSGNHFLAVFPAQRGPKPTSRRKLRGGGGAADPDDRRFNAFGAIDPDVEDDDDDLDMDYDYDDVDGWDGEVLILDRSQGERRDYDDSEYGDNDDAGDGHRQGSTGSLSSWMRSWCGRLLGRRSLW
jgi:OTU-like cysteine protease